MNTNINLSFLPPKEYLLFIISVKEIINSFYPFLRYEKLPFYRRCYILLRKFHDKQSNSVFMYCLQDINQFFLNLQK